MGFDPISIGLMAGAGFGPLAGLAAGGGAAAYALLNKRKSPTPKTPGPPPAPVEGGTETAKKAKKYRPAAQLFKDEDLRLGAAGRLGL